MFHLCMWWVIHSWGKEGGREGEGGGGPPWGLFQLLLFSQSGVPKFVFFFSFLRYNILVSAIFIVC
jgi:hypothetical protein